MENKLKKGDDIVLFEIKSTVKKKFGSRYDEIEYVPVGKTKVTSVRKSKYYERYKDIHLENGMSVLSESPTCTELLSFCVYKENLFGIGVSEDELKVLAKKRTLANMMHSMIRDLETDVFYINRVLDLNEMEELENVIEKTYIKIKNLNKDAKN